MSSNLANYAKSLCLFPFFTSYHRFSRPTLYAVRRTLYALLMAFPLQILRGGKYQEVLL